MTASNSIKIIIIMSLSILLSSSSFFLSYYLHHKIVDQHINDRQLNYAIQLKLDSALQYHFKKQNVGSKTWFIFARKLALTHSDVAIELADFYLKDNKKNKAIKFYQQAIKLGSRKASLALATLYFHQASVNQSHQVNGFDLANKIVEYEIHNDKNKALATKEVLMPFLLLKSKIAIAQGNTDYILKNMTDLSKGIAGQSLINKLHKYQILNSNGNSNTNSLVSNDMNNECYSLQFFATSLADLELISSLIEQFKQHVLSDYFCLNTPRYIPIQSTKCLHHTDESIRCDETQWRNIASQINTRYVGLLYPYGGANVHLGIVYLDSKDTIDIFAHELAHLIGFVDEYPLPKRHEKCRQSQQMPFAHNVIVMNETYKGNKRLIREKLLAQIPWADYTHIWSPPISQGLIIK